jgi:phospholipid/cholesterol/gamma-HCH transport system substrate-binding protein
MSSHVKLGIFVAVVFVVFLVFTLNITKGYLPGGQERYNIYFHNIGTLESGAPVKQAGYTIGYVADITPANLIVDTTPEKMIQVTVSVKPTAEVSVDSEAHIYTAGLMGEMYVEISYGTGRRLDPKNPQDFIIGTSPFSMADVVDQITVLTDGVKETLDNVNKIIGQEQARKSFQQIMVNLEELTGDLDELIGGEKQTLSQTLANVLQASENLKQSLAHADAVINEASKILVQSGPALQRTVVNAEQITADIRKDFLADMKKMSKQLSDVSVSISTIVAKVDRTIDQNEPNVKETLENLNQASRKAKESIDTLAVMIQDVRNGKGVLGRIISDESLGVETEATIHKVSGMVEHASTLVQRTGSLVNNAGDIISTVKDIPNRLTFSYDLRAYTEDDRYDQDNNNLRSDMLLRLDLTDSLFAQIGADQIGDNNEVNAMLGYMYGPWTARAGVIESEAGVSLDVLLLKRLLLGVRGVGLTEHDEERLDIYGSFRLWRDVYLIGGVDNVNDEAYPNVGLRIEF